MSQVSDYVQLIESSPNHLTASRVTLAPQSQLVDTSDYRSAMRMLTGGVTIILSQGENGIHGMTASATCSVSADPPLLLVCVNQSNRSKNYIAKSGQFSLNILSAEQAHISDHFAARDRIEMPQLVEAAGHAVIDDALASFVCDVQHSIEAGSHVIFVGSVRDVRVRAGNPLCYFNGAYGTAQPKDLEKDDNFTSKWSSLSPREREVLVSVVDGKPTKIIAHELGISVKTVDIHRTNIKRKFGTITVASLVGAVLSHGRTLLNQHRAVLAIA